MLYFGDAAEVNNDERGKDKNARRRDWAMNCRLHLHELKADAFMNCPAGMNCRRCLHEGVGVADGIE